MRRLPTYVLAAVIVACAARADLPAPTPESRAARVVFRLINDTIRLQELRAKAASEADVQKLEADIQQRILALGAEERVHALKNLGAQEKTHAENAKSETESLRVDAERRLKAVRELKSKFPQAQAPARDGGSAGLAMLSGLLLSLALAGVVLARNGPAKEN